MPFNALGGHKTSLDVVLMSDYERWLDLLESNSPASSGQNRTQVHEEHSFTLTGKNLKQNDFSHSKPVHFFSHDTASDTDFSLQLVGHLNNRRSKYSK